VPIVVRRLPRVDAVRMRFETWGGRPHWEYDTVRLGRDDHGTWFGVPPGTAISRPGVSFLSSQHQVVLVPHGAPFVATFYDRAGEPPCEVYVDITTPPVLEDSTVCAVDLDLDVIRGWTGRVWVDDEDEFAAHRTELGYPEDVVALAVASCAAVRSAVEAARPPYDVATPRHWIAELAAAMMQP
jgi:hypothetical protein